MRAWFCATLLMIPLASQVPGEDTADPILIRAEPVPQDTVQAPVPARGSLPFSGIDPAPLSLPDPGPALPAMGLLQLYPRDSLTPEQKAIAGFPAYWAKLEKENGIDALRLRLGMSAHGGTGGGNPLSGILVTQGQELHLNLLGIGATFYGAWRERQDAQAKEERFQAQVRSLMGWTREMRRQQGDAPAISLILAKLDFMGKRVGSRLPKRYDRKIFTENLKAWAANPMFDTTYLGPRLMELCRAYEEFED